MLRATTGSEFRYLLLPGFFNSLLFLGCFRLFDEGARCFPRACIEAGVHHGDLELVDKVPIHTNGHFCNNVRQRLALWPILGLRPRVYPWFP